MNSYQISEKIKNILSLTTGIHSMMPNFLFSLLFLKIIKMISSGEGLSLH